MDIQLPEVSGLEVTKWLKDDNELRENSRDRRNRLRHEGRRGADPRGRLRGLHVQADLRGPIPRDRTKISRHRGRPAMTARVLVVDDIPANVKLLEAQLAAEYYDVLTAMSGAEALEICGSAPSATWFCSTS